MSGGAASSWFLENRWATMARGDYDFGMAVDLMRKELALAIDERASRATTVPVAALCRSILWRCAGHGLWP